MEASSPFIKQLASSDKKLRDGALDKLRTYIRLRKDLDSLELLKLWKGLYFCMWMSDGMRVQQELARNLASLIEDVPDHLVIPFLEAFWKTIAREWTGIDALRMDKFLYLVRVYVEAAFRLFAQKNWKNEKQLENYLELLENIPFNTQDLKIPDGLRYHCLDIWVDEIEKVDDKKDGRMPILKLLQPIQKLEKESISKTVKTKARETLKDDRLKVGLGDEQNDQDQDKNQEDEWSGIKD